MIASPPLTPLLVFLVAYAGFIALPRHRAALACGASGLLLLAGFSTWRAAIQEHIAWNVLGLLTGMMVMAELFNLSRMPAVIAEHIARRCGNAFTALLLIIGIAAAFSTFLDNVSVVLLLAPVALGITRRLKISPVRTLMCIAVAANLEGTATLIGDPPSMLMAGHLKLSFNDFFFYKGKPGIFWAVQAGALASLAVVAWLLRDTRRPIHFEDVETVRSWVPTALLVALIGCLSLASRVDPGFVWLAGTATLGFALAGAAWYLGVARWGHVRELLHGIDFRTLGFLLGMFVLIGILDDSGWLESVARGITQAVQGSVPLAFVGIVLCAMLASAVIDNVPFLVAMLPVTQHVADQLGASTELLMFGLLIGACLGGNITPIGASANVVAIGILHRHGHPTTFMEFVRVGLPFTLAALLAGATVIWLVWA